VKFFNRSNILLLPFAILTGSIVVLCLLTQIVINFSLKEITSDSKTIDLAGKQQLLSQQIINSIAADNLAGILTQQSVDNLAQIFLKNEGKLYYGDGTMHLKPLEKFFWTEYRSMDSVYKKLFSMMGLLANSDNNNKMFVELLNEQEAYMRSTDLFISKLNAYSSYKIARFQQNEIAIMAGSLFIVFLEVIFIFLPAIRKIKKQSIRFKAIAFHQSHIVRQPLANIKGLLEIVDKNTITEETRQLLQHALAEAEKLDDVIKNTVYSTKEEGFF